MQPFLLAAAGALVGLVSGTALGALVGFAVGYLLMRVGELSHQQGILVRDNLDLFRRYEALSQQVSRRQAAATPDPQAALAPAPPPVAPAPTSAPAPPVTRPVVIEPIEVPEQESALPPLHTPAPNAFDEGVRRVTGFLTTGNVVAKAGVIVMFFGVAFLLRYAAERGMLPIEYRLMATAGGALALLAIGWRLRTARRDYALVLQGGAVGLLYLTIFAAFRLYDLLPAALTFGLLLGVVGSSAVLAITQGAMSLAVLGTSGGFLTPILASTGEGSHVALFSYYAVLNLGVLGIAWFRSWRFLNWLAFIFTFGIGAAWGERYYEPELLATTEPFLAFFFLLFVAVAFIHAHRQSPHLRGYIDGSLVFGTPVIAFGMQSVLVQDVPLGRAYSAVAVSGLYLALARAIWRRDTALRPLAESYFALAVVFLVVAVPMAFDGHATAAAWALEGAALVWVGVRQQRRLARAAGAALLVGAGAALFQESASFGTGLPVLNGLFLSGAAIAAGSLIAGQLLSKGRASLADWERPYEWVLLVWGLLWWLGLAALEIPSHAEPDYVVATALLGIALSGGAVAALARWWQWRALMLGTLPVPPLLWLLTLLLLAAGEVPLANLGWLAWAVVATGTFALLRWFEDVWPAPFVKVWHVGAAWHVLLVTAHAVAVGVDRLVPESPAWTTSAWCAVAALAVLALPILMQRGYWPTTRFEALYRQVVPMAPVAAIGVWVLWASTQRGSAAPLPYVPIVNPVELTQALAVLTMYTWWARTTFEGALEPLRTRVPLAVAGVAFVALNATVARGVHFFGDVPFTAGDLADSAVFQAGISILWGLTAGAMMTAGRLRLARDVWMMGAWLLAVIILKLFIVDLGNVGGIARIVSFLATGVLILAIGYFAPAPPKTERSV